MKLIYLVCGVPGSGKTWVCSKLQDQFNWLPHDNYPVANYSRALLQAAKTSTLPVIGEAPFRVSVLVEELRQRGADVREYWIIEPEATIQARYEARDHKPIPRQHLTNLLRYNKRTFGQKNRGTSEEILALLKKEAV